MRPHPVCLWQTTLGKTGAIFIPRAEVWKLGETWMHVGEHVSPTRSVRIHWGRIRRTVTDCIAGCSTGFRVGGGDRVRGWSPKAQSFPIGSPKSVISKNKQLGSKSLLGRACKARSLLAVPTMHGYPRQVTCRRGIDSRELMRIEKPNNDKNAAEGRLPSCWTRVTGVDMMTHRLSPPWGWAQEPGS